MLSDVSSLGIGALGIIGFGMRHADLIGQVARNVPCVLTNKALPGVPLPCAKPDLAQAARLTVEYFAARGRRRVGVLIRDATHPQQLEMLIHMEAELRRCGLDVDKRLWHEGSAGAREDVDRRMYAWVEAAARRRTPPDALAVFDSGEVVPRFGAALARRGGQLGRTFDAVQQADAFGDQFASYPWPAVVFDFSPVVRHAAALLASACRHPEPRGNGAVKVSPVRLVVPEAFAPSDDRVETGFHRERG